MEQKTVTIRLPQDVADFITRNGESVTEGVKAVVSQLQRQERYADMEIRGKFTPKEWKFLVDSFNGTMMHDDFRFATSALVAHNEDSQYYDGTATKWGVDIEALNTKCTALSASQVEAVYRRIERFWQHPDTDLEAWAKF